MIDPANFEPQIEELTRLVKEAKQVPANAENKLKHLCAIAATLVLLARMKALKLGETNRWLLKADKDWRC